MKRFFIFLIFLYSCEDKSTPTIYPSKIGVDSAYINLVKSDKPIKIENIGLNEKKVSTQKIKKQVNNDSIKTPEKTDKIVPLSIDNTINNLNISYGKASTEVTKIAGQTNSFTFDSDTAKKVWIKISTQDTLANIRINEIKGPVDSIKGGPFGKETIFTLPSRGVYQFSISEKPTISTPYAGKYKVQLKLMWK